MDFFFFLTVDLDKQKERGDPFYFASSEYLKTRTIQAMELKNKQSTLYDRRTCL